MNNQSILTKEDELIMAQSKQLSDVGLLQGKMGICLYYYISGRMFNNQQYTKFSDSLLDEIYNKMPTSNIHFDNGLIGIGCAIEYLVQHGYVTGNTDDILQEIDVQILKQLTNDDNLRNLNLTNGCAGYLYYLISRLQNKTFDKKNNSLHKLKRELLFHLINNIEKNLLASFEFVNKDISFDLFASLPVIISLLKNAYSLDVYNDKILKIIEQILNCLETMIPTLNINRLYLVTVLLECSNIIKSKQLEKCTNFLFYSIDYEDIVNEITEHNWSLRTGITGAKLILWDLLKKLPTESNYYDKINNVYGTINNLLSSLSIDDKLATSKIGISDGIIGVKLANYLIEEKI